MANYLISTQASGATTRDTIHDAETNLKVKAINLLSAVFTPRMYGNGHHASYMASLKRKGFLGGLYFGIVQHITHLNDFIVNFRHTLTHQVDTLGLVN